MRLSPVRLRRLAIAATAAAALWTMSVGALAAHPLGNFTINHYAGLRIGTTSIAVDYVLDMAEIPTFQERQRIDTNADGTVDAAETEAERLTACARTAPELALTLAGTRLPLQATAAGLSFPLGTSGIETLRLVCEFSAVLPAPLAGSARVGYRDDTWSQRIGWREVVAVGDGVTVDAPTIPKTSVSGRLTAYPQDLLSSPLDVSSAILPVAPGGPAAPAFTAPDAHPLDVSAPTQGPAASPPISLGAIPGGVTEQISSLLETKDLTPLALIGSLLVAAFLGALHAVSPGHGKTVMAAYLVGSRGSARHALALGVTVTVSHTLGVLALALVTLFASNIIPPERLYPVLGLASGALVVGIGIWLLYGRYRIWARTRADARMHLAHEHGPPSVRVRGFGGVHAGVDDTSVHDHPTVPGEHSHGGVRHTHLPASGADLTWRSLFSLGLAGGLVPSASALLLLLGSLAANRPAYGIVLVLAFGLGMAVVLGGVGLLLVYATRFAERVPSGAIGRRAWELLPVGTAIVVIGAGIYLTSQAITQVF
jgi:ABC-type nickel/cobalt efflux system permease component RcnA